MTAPEKLRELIAEARAAQKTPVELKLVPVIAALIKVTDALEVLLQPVSEADVNAMAHETDEWNMRPEYMEMQKLLRRKNYQAARAEIARLAAQLAKKERILEEIRLQGDSPEWQHEICMSCLKLIPHNHANCYDCKAAMIQMDMESPVPPADVTDAMEQAMLDEIDWELIGNIQGAVRKDGGVLDVTLRAMLMRGLRAALAARTKSADTP